MSKITVDASLSDILRLVKTPAELCDPDGNVLGQFSPPVERALAGGKEPPELSEQEWSQREDATEGFSTAEVLAYLETLK